MIAGVTSLGPSQLTPSKGVAKVCGADRDPVLAVLDILERERAVRLRRRALDRSRRACRAARRSPRDPDLSLSTSPASRRRA